jgi:hypothetical protein
VIKSVEDERPRRVNHGAPGFFFQQETFQVEEIFLVKFFVQYPFPGLFNLGIYGCSWGHKVDTGL